MFKSILVALDGLEASNSALDVSVEIAKFMKAKLKGLYVEDISRLMLPSSATSHIHLAEIQKLVEEDYKEEKSNISKMFFKVCEKSNLSNDFITVRDRISTAIFKYGKSSDLIVLGRRGKSFMIDDPDTGPVVEELLRHTIRPVIVVPPGAKLNDNILIAYDDSETSLRAISIGAQYARTKSAKVNLISVLNNEEIAELRHAEAKEFLTPYSLDVTYKTGNSQDKPWISILDEAKFCNAGLIVMGAYGHSKLKELVFGSTTKNVLMKAQCPVLLCR